MKPLTIRLYELADAEPMHEAALESVPDVFSWMAWCHQGHSLADAQKWVDTQVDLAKRAWRSSLQSLRRLMNFSAAVELIKSTRTIDLRTLATGFGHRPWDAVSRRQRFVLYPTTHFGRPT